MVCYGKILPKKNPGAVTGPEVFDEYDISEYDFMKDASAKLNIDVDDIDELFESMCKNINLPEDFALWRNFGDEYNDYHDYVIYINRSELENSRTAICELKQITENPKITQEDIDNFKLFCDTYNIPGTEPDWLAGAWYG